MQSDDQAHLMQTHENFDSAISSYITLFGSLIYPKDLERQPSPAKAKEEVQQEHLQSNHPVSMLLQRVLHHFTNNSLHELLSTSKAFRGLISLCVAKRADILGLQQTKFSAK